MRFEIQNFCLSLPGSVIYNCVLYIYCFYISYAGPRCKLEAEPQHDEAWKAWPGLRSVLFGIDDALWLFVYLLDIVSRFLLGTRAGSFASLITT